MEEVNEIFEIFKNSTYNLELKELVTLIQEMYNEKEDYKSKVNKAIEYLESYNTDFKNCRFGEAPISIRELGDLLNILKGEDKVMSDIEILQKIENYLNNRLEEWMNSKDKDKDLAYYNSILEDAYILGMINELREGDTTSVNTIITMPKYLKEEAIKHNINLSKVLQKEIKNILGEDK